MATLAWVVLPKKYILPNGPCFDGLSESGHFYVKLDAAGPIVIFHLDAESAFKDAKDCKSVDKDTTFSICQLFIEDEAICQALTSGIIGGGSARIRAACVEFIDY